MRLYRTRPLSPLQLHLPPLAPSLFAPAELVSSNVQGTPLPRGLCISCSYYLLYSSLTYSDCFPSHFSNVTYSMGLALANLFKITTSRPHCQHSQIMFSCFIFYNSTYHHLNYCVFFLLSAPSSKMPRGQGFGFGPCSIFSA